MKPDTIVEGDAYELIKQIPDRSVDLIVTDPPYDIKGIHSRSGIFKHRNLTYADELEKSKLGEGVSLKILPELLRVMKKCNIYLWCNKEQIYDYLDFFTRKHNFNFEMIVWAKSNVPPFTGAHYLKDKEYCLYFWETGVKLSISYKTGKTVYIGKVNTKDKKMYKHPTIKPQPIIENLIRNSGGENSIVLDPFCGSGTTCAAAKRLGSHYLGFEISHEYWKIATDRVNGITADERKKIDEGQLKLF